VSHQIPSLALVTVAVLTASTVAHAADDSTPPLVGVGKPSDPLTASGENVSTHSWEMPALTIGPATNVVEAQRIGSYGQPRWSARRLFTETRSYVIPEGQIEFEYWLSIEDAKRGDPNGEGSVTQQYEIEIGLPYRFQVDLYQEYVKEGSTGVNQLDALKFEVRWAFANWDVIPCNPTAYVEWEQAQNGDYDTIESKLLLCDEITDRRRWAANAVWEEKTGGDRERSRELTGGISYGVMDSKFALGIESKFAWVDTIDKDTGDGQPHTGDRTPTEKEWLIGPSAQIRPLPQTHIDLAWLAGLNDSSPRSKFTMIAGWEF
jgi:hypothetical protein